MKMQLSISPSSLSGFRQRLSQVNNGIVQAAKNGMDLSGEQLLQISQNKVPRRTNALAHSGKLTEADVGTKLVRIVSYGDSSQNPVTGEPTSKYALYVHEIYNPMHPNSYKWLEIALRRYGQKSFMDTLSDTLRKRM